MPNFAVECTPVAALPVVGSEPLVSVRRVTCNGRNFGARAIEMGHYADSDDPFFYQKNPDNLDPSGAFPCQPKSRDEHYVAEVDQLEHGRITLTFSGETCQQGELNRMIHKVLKQISCLSEYHDLVPGDVIQCGTPSDVAAVEKGDIIEGLGSFTVKVV